MKNKLKEMILNNNNYDISLYRVLDFQIMNRVINKIDNVVVHNNVKPNEIISSEDQFLSLLNRFVIHFKKRFTNVIFYFDYALEKSIENNYDLLEKYLLSKHYLGDNNYIGFFQEYLYKLSCSSLIKNAKILSPIRKLFIIEKLAIKNIDKYSLDELKKIDDLLSNLVFCNKNEWCLLDLFTDFEYHKNLSENKDNKDYIRALKENFEIHYDMIIDEYLKNKKYIKKFKYNF